MSLLTKFLNLFKDDPKWSAPATLPAPKVKQLQPKPVKEPTPYDNWSIEHYPETGRYYPRYKDGNYTKRDYNTGIYGFEDPYFFHYADYGKTEQEAWHIVDLVNEQQFKQNVIVLRK